MASDPAAAELRRRASALRALAGRLDATPLLTLHRWAGAGDVDEPSGRGAARPARRRPATARCRGGRTARPGTLARAPGRCARRRRHGAGQLTCPLLRYDPERIGDLERRATAAAADLVALPAMTPPRPRRCMPCARRERISSTSGFRCSRRLAASEAMLTWSSSGPPSRSRRVVGRCVARALGGAGTAELLIELGSQVDDPDEALAAAATVRDSPRRGRRAAARLAAAGSPRLRRRLRRRRSIAPIATPASPCRSCSAAAVWARRSSSRRHERSSSTSWRQAGDEPEYGGSLWGSTLRDRRAAVPSSSTRSTASPATARTCGQGAIR